MRPGEALGARNFQQPQTLSRESPDGQFRLDVVTTGQGELLSRNPDGTLTLQSVEPQALITVSVLGSDGGWVPMVGSGSFHITGLVVQAGDSFYFTGEAAYLHVEGKLTNELDGSEWSLLVVAVLRDGEFKKLTIELHLK